MLTDRFGRKRLLVASALMFTASAVWTAMSSNFATYSTARILGGLGIGLASNLSPMYIAEVSPASMRGKFVSINQLTIVIGILAAQIVNWLIGHSLPKDATYEFIQGSWYGQYCWRWMFAAETVPASLFFLLMFFVPESPRWLVKYGRSDEAEKILSRVGGAEYGKAEVADIQQTLASEEIASVRFSDLLEPKLMKIIALGVFLAVFQQCCGINVIFYYAQEVFQAAGYSINEMLFSVVIIGIVNLAATFIAIRTVDHLGRKPLMLIGAGGLIFSYALLGTGYYFQSTGVHMLLLIIISIGCYAMTLAPITWVLISELFPNRIRGAAMSIAVLSLWIACIVVAQTFPLLKEWKGAHGAFWIFGGICVVGFIVIHTFLPETKGKSLEDIERELVD
jgi:SP family sugar porter-like MFS transporter